MELRIDELAVRTGVSSRNIRAYQQRGLLPAPRLRGRTGFYDEEHLRRLELIRDLQARGFSLAAIRQTLDAWSKGGDIGDLLGLRRIFTEGWSDEQLVELSVQEVVQLFPEARKRPRLIEDAVGRGLLEPTGDGRYRASQVLMQAGADLARAGIRLEEIFTLVESIRANAAAIAGRFVELVTGRLIEPIAQGRATAEETHQATETVLRLRAVAVDVVRPFLAAELASATEQALQEFRRRVEYAEQAGDA